MDRELPVSVWPEWKIVEKIGEGSFGKVYKAQRTEKGRSFYSAIKVITIPASRSELNSIRSETQNDQAARDYFENVVEECIQEVSTMEYFRGNSHVVSVEDFKVMEYLDEIGWDIYIRMEYLTSFMDYCAEKTLTENEVMKLGIDLCRALEYCAQLHIIHRDIKPENIFVSRFGDFKLGDFGIARELERTMSSLSKKGTYSYMAPEMYRGEQYDSRVDIYSLGLVLYRLMNHNRLPFLNLEKQLITYRDKENALARRMSGEKLYGPVDAGAEFAAIICRACAYAPQERYQNPGEFRKALEELREGRSPAKPPAKNPVNRAQAEAARQIQAAAQPGIPLKSPALPETDGKKYMSQKISPHNPVQQDNPDVEGALTRIRRRRKRKKAFREPWQIVAVIMAAAAVIIAGVYLRMVMTDDDWSYQDVIVMNGGATDTSEGFARAMELIKERATIIVNNLDGYAREGFEGERLRYHNSQNQIMKVLVYPSLSEDSVYEEYYYWNEQLFFAYIWLNDKAEYYYYDDNKLIRWIDGDGKSHDSETDNPEYVSRGEKYLKNSIKELE